MCQNRSKYSLWLTTDGENNHPIDNLVSRIAARQKSAIFIPHVTLLAYLPANTVEFKELKENIDTIAASLGRFTITTGDYGYSEEEYRSLYLSVTSPSLRALYDNLSSSYPQVTDEPFQALPHISVLYGSHAESDKLAIIAENEFSATELTINSLKLYATDGPPQRWHHVSSSPLR